ncbi:transmembrane protein 243 isoform X2 [Numida meleagris]|uniref:transmembrane protein 243 isoform X2 n=1 Tax=Numida meleagris TaxID=8996 RepID=UPI000B3D83D8|nr:transmembrane protein 243 isoform X2 [Numida meleagris]
MVPWEFPGLLRNKCWRGPELGVLRDRAELCLKMGAGLEEHQGTDGAGGEFGDRIINLIVGGLTSLLLVVTLISAFVFPQLPPKPVNIFFAICIFLCCISAGILIYWYRQGDLEPKFRSLIYYILFSIVMLCICANLYFHEVGK